MSQLENISNPSLSPRTAWIATVSGMILTIAAVIVGYVFDYYGYDGEIIIWYQPLSEVLPLLAAFIVGGLIAGRMPHNIYGWIWLALGWAIGVILPWSSLAAFQAFSASPPMTIPGGIANQLAALGWLIGVTMIPFCMLYFPTGRLPSPRWRWITRTILIAALTAAAFMWASPGDGGLAPLNNPFGQEGSFGQTAVIISSLSVLYIAFVTYPLAVFSIFHRYRQAQSLQRAQLRWLLFMAAVNILFLAIDLSEIHRPWIAEQTMTNLLNIILIGLPIAVAIAILRYRLYDIDLIIRRTLVYAILTAALALVYFGTVVLLQTAVGIVTNEQSPLVIVFSTLFIAALFTPLRRRIQSFIDRRFYRRKYDAAQTLARFAERVRDEVEMEGLQTQLGEVVRETLQPRQVTIWIAGKKGRNLQSNI
jgi:MFS family permease